NRVWSMLRPGLERLSNHKCWFTEATSSIADFHVEHFRPKKKVELIKNKYPYAERRTAACTKGYWWLAYEIENLRLAGSKPNQKKRNYFPLETNSILATPKNNSWQKE